MKDAIPMKLTISCCICGIEEDIPFTLLSDCNRTLFQHGWSAYFVPDDDHKNTTDYLGCKTCQTEFRAKLARQANTDNKPLQHHMFRLDSRNKKSRRKP